MKRFVSTELFRTLREASQKGIDLSADVLKNRYDEFATLLFSEKISSASRITCYNALIYTRVELSGLTGVLGGKNSRLSPQIH
jgi:hypothetical protein